MKKALWAGAVVLLISGIIFYSRHNSSSGTPRAQLTRPLAVGDSQTINGVKVILADVPTDSRCPAGVECIQAGKLAASLRVIIGKQTKNTELSLPGDPLTFAGHTIRISSAAPIKIASHTITKAEYRVVFEVK